MPRCPECRKTGRKVKRATLESLLRAGRRADIGDGPYHVCVTPDCETVYFSAGGDETFGKRDLAVRFGLKETSLPRPVCYCFDHTVEEIHDEIRRTGRSTVLDSIKADMDKSGCRCEHVNPLGGCCLTTVREVVSAGFRLLGQREDTAVAAAGGHCCCGAESESAAPTGASADCCAPTRKEEGDISATAGCSATQDDFQAGTARGDRSGALVAGGSVLAAVLSSACCWLPLLLIAFGASAAGVAGFFEAYRPYLIAAAVILLGAGFYRAYFRAESCKPGSACEAVSSKTRTLNKVMLWAATALVVGFVFFPNYVGSAFGGLGAPIPAATSGADAQLVSAEFHIEGMTCGGCADMLRSTLAKLPDIADVGVDYAEKTAVVRYPADKPVPSDRVIEAVRKAGYTATLSRERSAGPVGQGAG